MADIFPSANHTAPVFEVEGPFPLLNDGLVLPDFVSFLLTPEERLEDFPSIGGCGCRVIRREQFGVLDYFTKF